MKMLGDTIPTTYETNPMKSPPITLASTPSAVTPPFVPCTVSGAGCSQDEARQPWLCQHRLERFCTGVQSVQEPGTCEFALVQSTSGTCLKEVVLQVTPLNHATAERLLLQGAHRAASSCSLATVPDDMQSCSMQLTKR